MHRWIQHKVLRAKYRKYALRISAVGHVIATILFSVFFAKTEIQEIEDAIQVELITELPRQVDKKRPTPVPKVEPPEPAPEMPELEEINPQRKEVTLQNNVNVVQQRSSLEIAKMPASAAAVDIEQLASQNIDVGMPTLETPDLATDARLEPTQDSILSPNVSGGVDIDAAGISKRSNTGVRNASKGTGKGIAASVSKTGAAEGASQIGLGNKNGSGTGNSGGGSGNGNGDGNATFSSIFAELTDEIIASSGGRPIDVVFVVDASGSMLDNINAVAEHLGQMTDAYKASKIDYQLGLTHFSVDGKNGNHIRVFQLTQNLSKIQTALYDIEVGGDEHALDGINETVIQQRFRNTAIKHLILVTDEPLSSLHGFTVDDAINLCRKNKMYVNVLGINNPKHKYLAAVTGGKYHPIPINLN